MRVKEIMKVLEKLDPESDVHCYSEDPDLFIGKQGIFEIKKITVDDAVKGRDKKGNSTINFTKSDKSTKHILINITTDF
jgi:hypothetical protein